MIFYGHGFLLLEVKASKIKASRIEISGPELILLLLNIGKQ